MKSKNQLYKAQTIGNIEPIEYMIPYPSTQSIIEGQVIKYGNEIVFEDYNLTNIQFFELIQKTSRWLHNQGISPKDNVVIKESSFLDSILESNKQTNKLMLPIAKTTFISFCFFRT